MSKEKGRNLRVSDLLPFVYIFFRKIGEKSPALLYPTPLS